MAYEMTWSVQSGFLTNEQLNKSFQRAAQPLFKLRQFVKFKSAFGLHKGQTENWLKVSNASDYGGKLTETSTMHETTQPLAWGDVTVNEYGLSIPLTFKIQALSEFDVKTIVRESLLDDMVKVVEGEIANQFDATLLRYIATGSATVARFYTNGTTTKNNGSAINSYHVRKIVTKLKTRNVPGFTRLGGNYVCVASHEAWDSASQGMESVNQYTQVGYEKILNGEVGTIHGVRFVEDGWGTRFTYDATARTATSKEGNWDSAGKSGEAYFFGSPTVREIVAVPEEIRAKVVTDYGRSHGIAWYGIFGWKIEWDTSGGADSRIIKWDSVT